MDDMTADQRTDLMFKALASKQRREVLTLLSTGAARDDERCCSPDEVCACVFAERLGLGAPTISHHMKILTQAGFVASEKRGAWVYYRLRHEAVRHFVSEISKLAGCENGVCR